MKNLLFVLFLYVCSCTPIATYPPIETDAARNFTEHVNEPVPTILVLTLEYAHQHFGGMEQIVFNLPEGIRNATYAKVAERIPNAVPMSKIGQPAYHIIELRVRGFEADADLLFPSTGGGYEMATIHLEAAVLEKWHVSRDRVWLVPISEVPQPNDTSIASGSTTNTQ